MAKRVPSGGVRDSRTPSGLNEFSTLDFVVKDRPLPPSERFRRERDHSIEIRNIGEARGIPFQNETLQEGMSRAADICFVEIGGDKQSAVERRRHPDTVNEIHPPLPYRWIPRLPRFALLRTLGF